jgi:ubiquinone/menaquinone biosynthesis C-methylase UbiE
MATDKPEHNYIYDPESPEELARLINWGRATTQAMGGVLAEQPQEIIDALRNVVDLACGPGDWVLDLAFAHPHIEVAGVDISRIMVDYANARARSQKLTNASFGIMDITRPLDFSNNAFDLVNARSLFGVLSRENWPAFIAECTRILRPGGILRLTDMTGIFSTSPTVERWWNGLMMQALHRIGYGFSPIGNAITVTTVLPHLFRKAGYQNVRYAAHPLDFSADSDAWADGFHSLEVGCYQSQPLLTSLGLVTPEEMQSIIQQILIEARAEDFCSVQHYMTVWGVKPGA